MFLLLSGQIFLFDNVFATFDFSIYVDIGLGCTRISRISRQRTNQNWDALRLVFKLYNPRHNLCLPLRKIFQGGSLVDSL